MFINSSRFQFNHLLPNDLYTLLCPCALFFLSVNALARHTLLQFLDVCWIVRIANVYGFRAGYNCSYSIRFNNLSNCPFFDLQPTIILSLISIIFFYLRMFSTNNAIPLFSLFFSVLICLNFPSNSCLNFHLFLCELPAFQWQILLFTAINAHFFISNSLLKFVCLFV